MRCKLLIMMYFLYNDNTLTKETQVRVYASSKKTYYDMQKDGFDLCGQFGRSDYANHWADYKNGKISEKEHKLFLGLPYNA
jgi:hypothetical protein